MKPLRRRWFTTALMAVLVLPCGAIVFRGASSAQGQFRPPLRPPQTPFKPNNPLQGNPNNPLGPRLGPVIEKTWTCSRCQGNLGKGDFPPATCPHCGARIVNGIGNGNGDMKPAAGPQGPVNNLFNRPPVQPVNPNLNGQNNNVPAPQPDVKVKDPAPVANNLIPISIDSGEGPGALPFIIVGIVVGVVLLALAVFLILRNLNRVDKDDFEREPSSRRKRRRPVHY